MNMSTTPLEKDTWLLPSTSPIQARMTDASCKLPSCEVDTVSNGNWDAIAAGFEDVSCEQTAAYCSARWSECKNSHLLLRQGRKVTAAARVLQFTIPGLNKGLAYVKFGPMWRRSDSGPDAGSYRDIIEAMVEEYCNRRGLLLSILPRPNPVHTRIELTALMECGFTNRRPFADSDRYFVDLSLDEDVQRASLGQTWRRNLKKGESANLDIDMGTREDTFAQFNALHESMVHRKNAAHGDAIELLPRLRQALPPSLVPKIAIACHDGKPVAGAVIALHGDTAYYVYGATNSAALPLRAGFALQWWIVRWLSDQGLRWYDLGGTAGNAGLNQFKSGLVGSHGRIVTIPGEFDRWSRPGDKLSGDALFCMRGIAKSVANKWSAGFAK